MTLPRPRSPHLGYLRALVLASGLVWVAGCSTVGPDTVTRDRFDYNGAIARSWKEQTLLNIVKVRYLDAPVFLDVSQIVGGYTLEGTLSLTGQASHSPTETFGSVGAQGTWSDHPTITYTPLTGAQFNRNMLMPIPPSTVLFTMQAGWPVDLVFRLVVQGINGIESTGATAGRYERFLTLMRKLQEARAIGMRMWEGTPNQGMLVFFFRARDLTPEQEAMRKEVREILGLPVDRDEFTVTFGTAPMQEGEIAMLTRSMMQIFINLSGYVEVPEADLRQGRAVPGRAITEAGPGRLRIKHSQERPPEGLVAVPYHGGWFWIDDRDLESKHTFALVMMFSTLTETETRGTLPLVTIPAR